MKKGTLIFLSMLLWALSAIIAGYQIFLTRHIVRYFYIRTLQLLSLPSSITERLTATAVGNIAALFMAFFAMAIVIFGFDFHWSCAGKRRSFKVLRWTFLFQFTIFAIYMYTR